MFNGLIIDEETIRQDVETFGAEYVSGLAQEEAAELIQAVSKMKRYGRPVDRIGLLGEVADTIITCAELLLIHDGWDDIQGMIDTKLNMVRLCINDKIGRTFSVAQKEREEFFNDGRESE